MGGRPDPVHLRVLQLVAQHELNLSGLHARLADRDRTCQELETLLG